MLKKTCQRLTLCNIQLFLVNQLWLLLFIFFPIPRRILLRFSLDDIIGTLHLDGLYKYRVSDFDPYHTSLLEFIRPEIYCG